MFVGDYILPQFRIKDLANQVIFVFYFLLVNLQSHVFLHGEGSPPGTLKTPALSVSGLFIYTGDGQLTIRYSGVKFHNEIFEDIWRTDVG